MKPLALNSNNAVNMLVNESVNSRKPPPKDYLREMKSKREQQMDGRRNHHLFNGAEFDKVLKS